ncbi:MAG: ROK family protein [Candidatus Wallbacteria bacterium]|nr:ROK family protein [Candidatus Wallbacteria bacterium]
MSDTVNSIGVDVGGTKIAAGVVTDGGQVLARERVATDSKAGYESVIRQIAELARTVAQRAGLSLNCVRAVGLGMAGQIEVGTGIVHHAVNLFADRDIPLGPMLSEALRLPVVVDNDVRASTLGEYLFGLAGRPASFLNVFAGTGVGSGFVDRGRLLRGAANSACEIGHHSIDWQGLACGCGSRGCLELYAGGLGVARQAREAMAADPDTLLWQLCEREPGRVDGRMVASAAGRGDATASGVIERAGQALGAGLANAANLLNPEVLMLGGGLMKLGEGFRKAALETFQSRALATVRRSVRLEASRLADDAGFVGAASLWRVGPDGTIA